VDKEKSPRFKKGDFAYKNNVIHPFMSRMLRAERKASGTDIVRRAAEETIYVPEELLYSLVSYSSPALQCHERGDSISRILFNRPLCHKSKPRAVLSYTSLWNEVRNAMR
jgi:hypothetical protein